MLEGPALFQQVATIIWDELSLQVDNSLQFENSMRSSGLCLLLLDPVLFSRETSAGLRFFFCLFVVLLGFFFPPEVVTDVWTKTEAE